MLRRPDVFFANQIWARRILLGADSLRIVQSLIMCRKNRLSVILVRGKIEQSNQAFCHGRVQLHVEIVDHEYRSFTKSVKEWTCKRQKLTSFIRLLRSKNQTQQIKRVCPCKRADCLTCGVADNGSE